MSKKLQENNLLNKDKNLNQKKPNTNIINSEKFTKEKNEFCNICQSHDEFSLCQKCFENFNERSNSSKIIMINDNQELKKTIQNFLDKRKLDIEKYNSIKIIKLKIENYKKLIEEKVQKISKLNELKKILIEKKNKNSEIILDIQEKTEELIKINTQKIPILINIRQNLNKKISEKEKKTKEFISNLLNLIFNKKIYNMEEIFEKDEYVMPLMNLKNKNWINKMFDQFTNILSSENREFDKGALEDNKNLYEEHLKVKDHVIHRINPFFFSNPNNSIKINFNYEDTEKDYLNKRFILEINSYLYKIILFEKNLSNFLKIKLPHDFINEEKIIIFENFFSENNNSNTNSNIHNNNNIFTEKNMHISYCYKNFDQNEIYGALKSLDKNFKFLLDFLGIRFKNNRFKGDINNHKKTEINKLKKNNPGNLNFDLNFMENNMANSFNDINKRRNFDNFNLNIEEDFCENFLDMSLFINYISLNMDNFSIKKLSDFYFDEKKFNNKNYNNDNKNPTSENSFRNNDNDFEIIENNFSLETNSNIDDFIFIENYFDEKKRK
jgi:hypothetical protein